MNQEDLARCHCIISHPSEPKFLAIQLSNGSWAPPWVSYPSGGFLGDKSRQISEGVLHHYGLKTTVLRHIFESQDHDCIELEVHSRSVTKPLKAIWIGREEYRPLGNFPPVPVDPFVRWLEDKERRFIPEKRTAWEREGWFNKAVSWIDHELDSRNIQVTGSVRQLRAGWYSSTILQVNTAQGYCYFKAAHHADPNEAAVTMAIARKWPQWVPEPLAVDVERNWMLSRDYGLPLNAGEKPEDYSGAARALAELQIESLQDIENWEKFGCRTRNTERLAEFLVGIDSIYPVLSRGRESLASSELDLLETAVKGLHENCEQISELTIPDMLVHHDFKSRNLYRREQGYWITDWADAMIAHPFISLARIVNSTDGETTPGTLSNITAAYLEPFEVYGSPEQLERTLAVAAKLADVATLCRLVELMPQLEEQSMATERVDRAIQGICRKVIWRVGDNT